MTDEQVVELRRQVRRDQCMNLKAHAARLGVNVSSISEAIRGISFKVVNDIEPPVTGRFKSADPAKMRIPLPKELVEEAIRKRRMDPVTWSHTKLAEWISQETGKHYRPAHIGRYLNAHDETMRDIKPIKRKATQKTRDVVYESQTPQFRRRRDHFAREELRYEQWVNAGSPDWGPSIRKELS